MDIDHTPLFEKQRTRRTALKTLGTAALAGMMLPEGLKKIFAKPARPNIVFILTDDHRWDAMSCMNHPFIKTPHMDRLAREGILFENAFVTTSLCSPSRASFLTGQYAHRHGVANNFTPWDDQNVTFFEYLKKAGYRNAFIGKWHMPGEGLPKLRGIDHFVTFTKHGGQGSYYDCPLYVDGVREERKGKYITEDLTDYALRFIERAKKSPFCLYLSHKATHFGYVPPKHLNRLYDGVDLKLPAESNRWVPFTNNNLIYGQIFPLDFMYRNYCETVVSVDEQLGRLLKKLEEIGELDNTVVVYAGDNGFFWGEHGLIDKRLAYEESIRIPFIIRYPGLVKDPGRRAKQMALNIDLAPTLLSIIGLPVPHAMQGQSLAPVLKSKEAPGRESWLYEYFPDYPIHVPGITAVRTGRYKYVRYRNNKRPAELFDLEKDPREMRNVITTEQGRKLAAGLSAELEKLKRETDYRYIGTLREKP